MKTSHQYSLLSILPRATALAVGLVWAMPSHAQEILPERQKDYKACMQLTRVDPSAAFERALSLQDMGGGIPARHCAAVALMMLGDYGEAAKRFEEIARMMPDDASADTVASILAHAGIAWMEADDLDRAYAAQSAALELNPTSAPILIDRAMVLAARKNYWDAIDDLNKAIEINPDDPVAYVYRASAYRFVEANDLAMDDANRALSRDPDNAEALLERGILYRLAGNLDAARKDWVHLIEKT
jgi:tetratricopeptide (TPR) repeat protein